MGGTRERIAFDVETSRILQDLSVEIYNWPKAFLRENVQNAYDAILMRCTEQGLPLAERSNPTKHLRVGVSRCAMMASG